MKGPSDRPTIAVAVCTYNRNEPLAALLAALLANAVRLAGRAAVGVVVVDDSTDGSARSVVERFEGRFELGITYKISARQNISLARNMAFEAAIELADWTAMTDDDCEPVPEWLEALLEAQLRTGADAVTGPMVRRMPPGSPRWLTDEPFLEIALRQPGDGTELGIFATHNSMISSRWLKDHPTIRFEPALGVTGGEDMVFSRAARAEGLKIHYEPRARVYENEPPSRATLAYQLRLFFWLGNIWYATSTRSGAARPVRLFLYGGKSLLTALGRPIGRVCGGRRPQLRYSLASVLHAAGMMIGPLGIRVRHQ